MGLDSAAESYLATSESQIRLTAEANEAERAAAEQAAAFPFVPQDVTAAAVAVGAGFDVARIDAHRHAMRDVLRLFLAALEGGLDVTRAKPSVAANIDWGGTLDGNSQRFEAV